MTSFSRVTLCVAVLTLVAGCSHNPYNKSYIGIEGAWEGVSITEYPGPADEPLVDTITIYFNFYWGQFTYTVRSLDGKSWVLLKGKYSLEGDSIKLTLDSASVVSDPQLLDGVFFVDYEEPSLRLYQVQHPETWPVSHDVKLTRPISLPD